MKLTRTSQTDERLTSEIEGNFAEKSRRIWTTEPDPKQLREGERNIYKAGGTYYGEPEYGSAYHEGGGYHAVYKIDGVIRYEGQALTASVPT